MQECIQSSRIVLKRSGKVHRFEKFSQHIADIRRKLMVDSGASLRIRFSKSKDSSIFMTADGTTRDGRSDSECQRSGHVCFVLSVVKLCEETSYLHKWRPGHSSFLSQNGMNIDCETDNHIPAFAQASKRPISTRLELWVTRRANKLWKTNCRNQDEDYLNDFNHIEKV